MTRYALLTVDTEALPKRADGDHVQRLIWGHHDQGTAGIREICAVGAEFGVPHVFFVDMCAALRHAEELRTVVRWLDMAGQDVQLHLHPETLAREFWSGHGLAPTPAYINEYAEPDRALFLLKHFGGELASITGKRVLACRAGSLRWNADFIRALRAAEIPLSFNNSMRAYMTGRATYAEPTNQPFTWSNGVIEVPLTERHIPPGTGRRERWVSLTYPESSYFPFKTRRFAGLPGFLVRSPSFAVLLMHSWSFLYWNDKRRAVYLDDRRLEAYRALVARVSADYDVITSAELLDLYRRGRIRRGTPLDLRVAEMWGDAHHA
ncbi:MULTISPECIES: polysaccharide deacetylase [unclassified Achromobacter]|uniref:polysaccharide deacetylase n=1 Tax=unclassified Achromobacter TaxID=2626865 RepID=UPI000B517B1A|nr:MULTISPECIES: polysaccharide deacetylase [unclassified Achromobacter]OWT72742.1 polysaccharide deacetylase [Achromobacter sp. HZ34]OWT73961.1 polysaccharide deacetylase [Achromobacter sp. HZ28]